MLEEKEKFSLPENEKKILEFWEKNKIFEKSVTGRKLAPRFVFYDGPPFATGLPHYGHLLASTVKDAVPRYWTMKGFRVDRRWGWDCHGLPIEHLVEQELGISGRKSIEKFGIKKFNEVARSKVLTYTQEWHKTIRRLGRFVDFENSYKTMDASYMESVWWVFASLYKKGLVYKDSRTSLFCPRCETPLSNFEIAMDNSYRDQEDDSVYVKLPLQDAEKEFLLVWTTTPWTIPGNTAVAVNPKLEYTKFKIGSEFIWSVIAPPSKTAERITVLERCSGKSLLGRKYEPPFRLTQEENVYRVVGADFVDVEEGTGLVHIAPAFGEEDFILGKKERLPILEILDDTGRFVNQFPSLQFLTGKKTEEANRLIIERLKTGGCLWKVERIMHRYPICWRCSTPLIYKVQPAWFIRISAFKTKMQALNEKIDWHPEHLQQGRFGKGLETAPDWNVSRSRFWGTPIPIWECEKCPKIFVMGSRDEFHKQAAPVRNTYFIMRHGEAVHNIRGEINSSWPDAKKYRLTLRGRQMVEKTVEKLRKHKIDLIVASDFMRTLETAEIVRQKLGLGAVSYDSRLREVREGILDGELRTAYAKYFSSYQERLTKKIPGGETTPELRARVFSLLSDLEKKYTGKKILIVSHEYPLRVLYAAAQGLSNEEMFKMQGEENFISYAEVRTMAYKNVPRNDTGELDFHRPYVDEVSLVCGCGKKLRRIPDVFDCWFESGSMPFAAFHYPFDGKKVFRGHFPAHFIAEYIAQTRGWFYTLHVLATALFGKPAFLHAVTTGIILSEQGEKLSKSRKNFPDPWLLFERYGVDAVRYYLMTSPVMLAENINFSEKDVGEVYKKYSLTVYNVLNFFRLYQYRLKKFSRRKIVASHVLDRWILSKLHTVIWKVSLGFDAYDIVQATRPLLNFVQDLSLWYLRRSRERAKSDTADAGQFVAMLHSVLFDFSRLTAPVTPFLAETIYQKLVMGRKRSVHLEDWPKVNKRLINKSLEEKMVSVREIASQVLRLRAAAGIKVRQPLSKLQIANHQLQNNKELLDLIKEEANVKQIVFGGELRLDTAITPELKEEGVVREFIRNLQEMRRDLGLNPKNVVILQIQGDRDVEVTISKNSALIKKEVKAREIKIGGKKIFKIERDLHLDGQQLWVGIWH